MALRRIRAIGVVAIGIAIPVFVLARVADLVRGGVWIDVWVDVRVDALASVRQRVGPDTATYINGGVGSDEENRGVITARGERHYGEEREKAPFHDNLWKRPVSPRYTSWIASEFNKLHVPQTPSKQPPSRELALTAIVDALRESVAKLESQAAVARDEATNEQSKQESKYDTRAIEAGYLAGAQSRRMLAVVSDLKRFASLSSSSNASEIVDGPCLVGLADEAGKVLYYFLGPGAAGLKVDVGGVQIMVITASAPLGKALLRAEVGDETVFGELVLVE